MPTIAVAHTLFNVVTSFLFLPLSGVLEKIVKFIIRPGAGEVIAEPVNPIDLLPVKGGVSIENVSFKYLNEWVLEGINLSVPAGMVVALVGPSGAGKSTIADLIPRFYDVNKGRILIDGKDVKSVSKNELRSAISVVSQDTFLFNATIEENIQLGRQDATPEDIRDAARHAFAHDFIELLEDWYDTVVGDRGTRLSGGQKQRIAIARAFLKQSPILILDEATSALDTESEQLVQLALEKMMVNRTSLIIAHRLSTIQKADLIVVLKKGEIVEQGKHEELLQKKGEYFKLVTMQSL